MGFKQQSLSQKHYQKKSYKQNLQQYYSTLYDQTKKQLKQQNQCSQVQIDRTLSSIFSRTKIPTKIPEDNQFLKMLDIDKLISINQGSMKENGQEIKHMRMVASLKNQGVRVVRGDTAEDGQREESVRPIDDLVRLARLHFMRAHHEERAQRMQNLRLLTNHDDSSQEDQTVRF